MYPRPFTSCSILYIFFPFAFVSLTILSKASTTIVISRTATEYLLSLVILFTLYTVTQVTAGGAGIKTDQHSTLRELRGQRTAFTLVHPRQ
jgi:hypothetical protein